MSPINTWGVRGEPFFPLFEQQFTVLSCFQPRKSLYFAKKSRHTAGRRRVGTNVTKLHIEDGEGSNEGKKSVTYYLNGPS